MSVSALSSQDQLNIVQLRGRLAAAPESRDLPSGDVLVTLRLVVARPAGRQRPSAARRQVTVDTIDCTVWKAALRRRVTGWGAGDQLVVEGSLRRRFWRGPSGAQSRYEVEIVKARRESRG